MITCLNPPPERIRKDARTRFDAARRTAKRWFPWLMALVCAGVCLGPERAWPQPGPTNAVQPTVTATMGDVGGKFFGGTPDPARTRHYWIAAEPELWDYAPQGR